MAALTTSSPLISPVLFSFQQFPVGGDLNVQSQLNVHQFLVLADLSGHVLLGSLQSFLQFSDAEFSVLHCQLAALLRLRYLSFQVVSLRVNKVTPVQKC